MFTPEIVKSYHIQRWSELPDILLYMDQTVSILEKKLDLFGGESKKITSPMVNNYVKQKIVKPPIKKKYDRTHIAYLFTVCVFKRFLTISEICDGIEKILGEVSVQEAYDTLCDRLEWALKTAFLGENSADKPCENRKTEIITAVAESIAKLEYASYLINIKDN